MAKELTKDDLIKYSIQVSKLNAGPVFGTVFMEWYDNRSSEFVFQSHYNMKLFKEVNKIGECK